MKTRNSLKILLILMALLLTTMAQPTVAEEYALHFDGDDLVTIPDSPSLNPAEITLECWVNFDRLGSGPAPSGCEWSAPGSVG